MNLAIENYTVLRMVVRYSKNFNILFKERKVKYYRKTYEISQNRIRMKNFSF